MKEIEKSHFKEYNEEPEIVLEAPQLTTIFGAFSEYISGYAIMTTNNCGMRLSLSRRNDNNVKAINVTRQDKKKFVTSNIKFRKEDRWANAIKAIIYAFNQLGYKISGMNITLKGESASADNVSLAAIIFASLSKAFNILYKLNLSDEELMRIALKANEFNACCQARKQDLIMLFSALDDKFVFFDLENYTYQAIDFPFYDIGVKTLFLSPSLPPSVLSPEVEEFRDEIKSISSYIKYNMPKGRKIRDLEEKELRLICLNLNEAQKRYANYLLEESNVCKNAWDSLLKKDLFKFSKLLNQQQKNITHKAELTCPEIDWIVRRSSETDEILGLSQVYVGIAGTMFSIIKQETETTAFSRLEEYERIFGFHPLIRDYIPSSGLRVV